MKVLVVLMCAVIAIQARSTAVSQTSRSVAELGENPWLLHLRIAVSTSGLLETCAGTLIDSSWALTAAACVNNSRFIWIRYGTINVITPELVTENSIRLFPNLEGLANDVAIININRVVQYTANISPVALLTSDADAPESAKFCSYNDVESEVPGEILTCGEVDLEVGDETIVAGISASKFDLGAGLVSDGVQVGVLVATEDGVTTFARPGLYLEWIEAQTGLDLSSRVSAVVA